MKTWQKLRENQELWKKYRVREQTVDTIREFFKSQGFMEVFTPTMVPVPSCEPNLEPFKTQLQTSLGVRKDGYLIMSPEFSLKKLLAAGSGDVFEVARVFRNKEEVSSSHNPEFTMLEWYRVNADYMKIAEDFERLFLSMVNKIQGGNKTNMTYQGVEYDLSLPWPRISFEEAFLKYAGKKLDEVKDEDFYQIFFNEIEPKLRESRRPAFVYDYPVSQASLARRKQADPRFAERWEVFLAGLELGNCFSELTDWQEQKERFEKELVGRDLGMDEDFIEALKMGLPDCAGIAVGVDRLVMLAADVPTLAETLFFPAGELW